MRSPRTAACSLLAICVLLTACGTKATVQGGNDTLTATTLTVYSDLPLLGADGAAQQSIVDGEALALYDAGGRVRFGKGASELHISLDSLNDADPKIGAWTAGTTGVSARAASSDLSSAAYIGDFDSGATFRSLPLNNEYDVLQVSPGSPYLGFTDHGPGVPANQPRYFYPFGGLHTFARLVPSYAQEARATVAYMRALGVRRLALLADTDDPLDGEIVPLVAAAASAAGIAVTARAVHGGTVADPAGIDPRAFAGPAKAIAAGHPDAVLYGGAANVTAPALWQELHAALPHAKLFAPSTLAVPSFRDALGAAAEATYVTSPYLEPDQYPPAAQRVFREFRRAYPGLAPTAYALYGYEAMRVVLAAIRRAGRQAPNRKTLRDAFFRLGVVHGVIGSYRITPSGDTTLDRFDGFRVGAGGSLVLVRPLS